MFLSEILPKDKVERCVLVDKAWAIASKETTALKPHHMNWDHIYSTNPITGDSSFTTWPIRLYTSKQGKVQSVFLYYKRELKLHCTTSRSETFTKPQTNQAAPVIKSKWTNHHSSSTSLWDAIYKGNRYVQYQCQCENVCIEALLFAENGVCKTT
jgi:hypothetical protein